MVKDWPLASTHSATSRLPHSIDQAIVSSTLDDCSRTLITTTLPTELAMVAVSARPRPSRKCPLPPDRISLQAPRMATAPALQVRQLIGVPKAMRLRMGFQNTISANSTATRPETRYCSEV